MKMTRRAGLMMALPLALGGCSLFDFLNDEAGKPVPGNREKLLQPPRGLVADSIADITLPPVETRAAWPMAGGIPTHAGGNLAGGLTKVWSESIGAGGDYRSRLTAQPLISGSQVFAMDTDGVITARDLGTGKEGWSTATKPRKNKSTNIGGGIAYDNGRIYAVTGRAELLALSAADGAILWRRALPAPGRGAPLVVDNTVYLTTVDQKLSAYPTDGKDVIWSYSANHTDIGVLASASPAFAEGLVVAGFESGDLAAVRADTGTLAWSDNLGTLQGNGSLIEFASIRGAPVIDNGLVYAIGLGGLFACLDLRSGRRVWERDVAGSNTPWLAGDTFFIIDTEQRIAAVSKADGTVHWVTQLRRFEDEKKTKGLITWTGPILLGGKLVALSTQKHMAVLDPIDGKLVSDTEIDWSFTVAPSVAQGTVLMLADDATLVAYK